MYRKIYSHANSIRVLMMMMMMMMMLWNSAAALPTRNRVLRAATLGPREL